MTFPLSVKRPLIFQPPSVSLHATNFFTVEVRHRVIGARTHGIDPVFLYPVKKCSLLRSKLDNLAPIQQLPRGIAEDGSYEPAKEGGGERQEAHGNHGVGGYQFRDLVGEFGLSGEEEERACGDCGAGDDGGSQREATSRGAEGEKGVPVENAAWCLGRLSRCRNMSSFHRVCISVTKLDRGERCWPGAHRTYLALAY